MDKKEQEDTIKKSLELLQNLYLISLACGSAKIKEKDILLLRDGFKLLYHRSKK